MSEALQVAEITIVDVRVAQVEVFDVAELPKLREMRLLEGAAADRGRQDMSSGVKSQFRVEFCVECCGGLDLSCLLYTSDAADE